MLVKNKSITDYRVILLLIIALGAFLRFYKLSYQSYWLDECITMIECNPLLSWKELLNSLSCCDLQPPLYHSLEKLILLIFGYNDYVGRVLSAILGTTSIWIIFLLGKELIHKDVGLIAAVITAINPYNIQYSQEARPYILVFVTTTVSFLFLIRLLKKQSASNILLYGLTTLVMIYSHYFAMFAYISQWGIIILLTLIKDQIKWQIFKSFLLANIIVIVGYLPWIPILFSVSKINSYWIDSIPENFASSFFYTYFGDNDFLKPFLLIFLFLSLEIKNNEERNTSFSPQFSKGQFSFFLCIIWIFIGFFIPYMRSILSVPILIPRYTIVVLPAFILLIAAGIKHVQNLSIRVVFLIVFSVLSLFDFVFVKEYYSRISKTQFRELAHFIVSNGPKGIPVITERTPEQQRYYLSQLGSTSKLITGRKEAAIELMLKDTAVNSHSSVFWLVGAHGDKKLDDIKRKELEKSYCMVNSKDYFDAWAQLYVLKSTLMKKAIILDFEKFKYYQPFEIENATVIPIWESYSIKSDTVFFPKGTYRVVVLARGTKAENEYPHLNVYLNESKIGNLFINESYEDHSSFFVEVNTDTKGVISIEFDNDKFDPVTKQDRNTFIKNVLFYKL
jgi:hypothetical protein